MTDIEPSIVTKLAAIARVYPLQLPEQTTYPAIVYQRISTANVGRTHDRNKMTRGRFQFSVYAKSYDTCRTTADAIDASMDMQGYGNIKLATNENRFDVLEIESGLFRVTLEYFVWY